MLLDGIIVLRQIIKNQLSLRDDQIFLYNQDVKLPNDNRLYIILQLETHIPYSITTEEIDIAGILNGETAGRFVENIGINLLSFRDDTTGQFACFSNVDDVFLALNSVYSKQMQDKYQFRIFGMEDATNVSAAEGSAMIGRMLINVKLLTWKKQTTPIDYYNQINTFITKN